MGRHEKPSRQPQENGPAAEGEGGGTAPQEQESAAPPENAGGTHTST
ncbi:hypothetical protein [Marinitenerispora sediminis]|nr:hypothetical protein [Marinitenerispora sediminis]